jgi:proteic killer suppression protein
MIQIIYAPKFIRMYKGLEPALKEEVREKISLFMNENNHSSLKVHKLKGDLRGCYSFSVNYKFRIIFEYENKKVVNFLSIGSHDGLYR